MQPTKKMDCPVQIRVTRALCVKQDVVAGLMTRKGKSRVRSGQSGQVRRISFNSYDHNYNNSMTTYERKCLSSAIIHYYDTAAMSDLEEKYLYRLPQVHEHRYHITGELDRSMKEPEFHPYMKLDEILVNPIYRIDKSVTGGLQKRVSDCVTDSAPDEVCSPVTVQKCVECNARKKVIDECKATIREFESLMHEAPVEELRRFAGKLHELTKEFASVVP